MADTSRSYGKLSRDRHFALREGYASEVGQGFKSYSSLQRHTLLPLPEGIGLLWNRLETATIPKPLKTIPKLRKILMDAALPVVLKSESTTQDHGPAMSAAPLNPN